MQKIVILFTILLLYVNSQKTPRLKQSCVSNETQGFFWDGQHCEYCGKDCSCNGYLQCDKCPFGMSSYAQDPTMLGTYCQYCGGDGINTCCFEGNSLSAIRATSCYSDYNLYGSVCKQVPQCSKYYDYGACQSCVTGYYLSFDQTCVQCTSDTDATSGLKLCKQCTGEGTCAVCIDGYYRAEQSETSDPQTQSKAGRCEKCQNENKDLRFNCICNSASEPKCVRCIFPNNYFINALKECRPCPEDCATCTQSIDKEGDTVSCITCPLRSTLYESDSVTKQKKCTRCPENCFDCTYNTTAKATKCNANSCDNGYYSSVDTATSEVTCVQCTDANAARCDDAKKITQCKSENKPSPNWPPRPDPAQYYLLEKTDGSTICQLNLLNCRRMIPKPATEQIGKCESCYPNWIKVYTLECKLCDLSYCLECQAVPSSETLACIRCINGQNKKSYSSQSVQNYYIESGKCSSCSDSCMNCNSSVDCTQCQSGYQLKDKQCLKCTIENCKICNAGIDTCDVCWEGLRRYLDTDQKYKCNTCEEGCSKCDGNRKSCEICISGRYLENGQCIQPRNNCAVHNSNGSCAICNYGFRTVDGSCRSCYGIDYINCQSGCSGLRYMRDGISLTQEFNDKKNYPPKPANSMILVLNFIAFIFAIFALI